MKWYIVTTGSRRETSVRARFRELEDAESWAKEQIGISLPYTITATNARDTTLLREYVAHKKIKTDTGETWFSVTVNGEQVAVFKSSPDAELWDRGPVERIDDALELEQRIVSDCSLRHQTVSGIPDCPSCKEPCPLAGYPVKCPRCRIDEQHINSLSDGRNIYVCPVCGHQISTTEYGSVPLPRHIHIETTTVCQAKCSFCPHGQMSRPLRTMNNELFEKVVHDAKDMGITEFFPFLHGEPFLDKRLKTRLETIFQIVPGAAISLYTNGGAKIDPSLIPLLQKCTVILSIAEGINKKTRKENYQLLKDNQIPMAIHCVDIPGLLTEAKELVGNDTAVYKFGLYNWRGWYKDGYPNEDGYCCRPRLQICVLVDGRVSLCCMDYDGDMIMGDAKKDSLKDIWFNDKFEVYRSHRKSELEFCKDCNMR